MGFRITVIAVIACLLGPLPTSAAAPTVADEAAIHGVILGQIDAFRRDDADGAFAYAAPGIQTMFGNPATFLQMVQRSYTPVYRPRSVDFTSLTEEDGTVVQLAELIGPDGLAYTARYTMEQEADGSWRISSCQLLESRRLGA